MEAGLSGKTPKEQNEKGVPLEKCFTNPEINSFPLKHRYECGVTAPSASRGNVLGNVLRKCHESTAVHQTAARNKYKHDNNKYNNKDQIS